MEEMLQRLWDHLIGRFTGPMNFRLILQPLASSAYAIWSGIKDARAGRPAFLWTAVSDPGQRRALLRSGWKDVRIVFTLAVVLDAVYQLIQLHAVHLLELLIVAPILAFVPYILLRGPVTRIAAALIRRKSA
jgi:hypothetical protein